MATETEYYTKILEAWIAKMKDTKINFKIRKSLQYNAIESIRTTNSSNSKYNKNALFEIKTNLQHNNIVLTVDNAVPYKLRQFIKSLETKK